MREPVTIPEYKEFCKALKLKVLKQKTTIESQAQQIERLNSEIKLLRKSGLQPRNQNDPNSAFMASLTSDKGKATTSKLDTETLQGKNQIMNKFKNGACSFGITPQSIFRIADFGYKGQVQADYFRQVLSKIQLGLTPQEISCLIYIFDQNCTGFIHRDDYNDSLNAYEISLEQSYLQYTSACLEKLAKLIEAEKIPVVKFFQEMEGRTVNSVDLNRFSEKLRTTFGKKLQMKEIMGAFNAIDLETDGIICRKNFVYGVTSAINKMLNTSSVARKTNSFEDHQNQFQRSTLSNKKSNPNNTSSVIDPINQPGSPSKTSKDVEPAGQDPSDVLARIYNTSKITLHQIYEEICRSSLNKRLTLLQFKKILGQIQGAGKIDPELSSQLFKSIDSTHKGSVFIRELMQFYLAHETDMSIIFHLIGLYFKNNDLTADRFWFLYGVSPDSDISKNKFIEVMGKAFATNQETIWEKLWQYFDKGRGVVAVASINKELSKYEMSE